MIKMSTFFILSLFPAAVAAQEQTLEKVLVTDPTVLQSAVVTFKNGTPPNWDVTLRDVGATFNYDTGGAGDVVQKNGVGLRSGNSYQIASPKSDCVIHVRAAVVAVVPRQDPAVFFSDQHANPGECILAVTFNLAPKNAVLMGDRGKLQSILEMRQEE